MRSIFTLPAALAFALVTAVAAVPARAQAADDDLYGVPGGTSQPDTAGQLEADTARAPAPRRDTIAAPPAPDTTARPAPRPRITRETTINPLDVQKGSYRNPKKALFMSLLVPGLGQAYVGQSAFTYTRAALYFGTEVVLGALWYQYTVVKYDRQVNKYRRYADEHWSMGQYEDRAFLESNRPNFANLNLYRQTYCSSVQERSAGQAENLYQGCLNLIDSAETANAQFFRDTYDDRNDSAAQRRQDRAAFADVAEFYNLIGRYQEFIAGWDDAVGVIYSDSAIAGTSLHRDEYTAMREKAQDYSRMQAWFIGGIVLNHIASAVDAALTARRNNKRLYEGEARWFDNLHMDGGLAFEAGRPRTHLLARLSF